MLGFIIMRFTFSGVFEPDALGYLNVALSYNRPTSSLVVTILSARGLSHRQYYNTVFFPNPFVKVYLLPGRKVSSKRRTKFMPNTSDPVWNQTVEYTVPLCELYSHYLEFTVWDYNKFSENNSLGQVVINLSEPHILDGTARWYQLQAIHNNFVSLPGPQFQSTISSETDYAVPRYNPRA
ncbi:unnamed protein product [Gongylonema pulchrum]|uniref:C2 domain-containing protein n=1 Tax=Gongylonema pulchrum TaxID=637853 RepID=A0A183CX79_9BILA|nr:unnamed protein product [Gongylonema pulchrum]